MSKFEGLSRRLKEIRKSRGLTQEAFAQKLGVARMSYAYYESGQRTPDILFLERLHELTGYPYDYLMGTSEAKETENISLSAATGLSDKAISWIKSNADFLNIVIDAAASELQSAITSAALFAGEGGIYSSNAGMTFAGFYRAMWNNSIHDLFEACKIKGYEMLTPGERTHVRELIRTWQNEKKATGDTIEPVKNPSRFINAAEAAILWKDQFEILASERERSELMDELQWLDDIYRRANSNEES